MLGRKMIPNIRQKIKRVRREVWDDLFIAALVILVGLSAFALGRLSVLNEADGGFQIVYPDERDPMVAAAVLGADAPRGDYVASKSGTKYHFTWCPGAQSIKEENKIFFATKEEAERAGYGPAANCKGM